eukprot:6781394-Karenia_brevis.AAC.1
MTPKCKNGPQPYGTLKYGPGVPAYKHTFPTWITWLDVLPHLDYLDGQPSPLGLPGCTTFTACISWMEKLHCLHYPDGLDGQPSLTLI